MIALTVNDKADDDAADSSVWRAHIVGSDRLPLGGIRAFKHFKGGGKYRYLCSYAAAQMSTVANLYAGLLRGSIPPRSRTTTSSSPSPSDPQLRLPGLSRVQAHAPWAPLDHHRARGGSG